MDQDIKETVSYEKIYLTLKIFERFMKTKWFKDTQEELKKTDDAKSLDKKEDEE